METRTVLVTGCSTGMGLAVAVRLAKDELRRFKVILKLHEVGWETSVHNRIQVSPEMFNRIQVCTLAGPLRTFTEWF